MKRSVVWVLLSYSVLGFTVIPVRAQETAPEPKTLVVEPGNDFRTALEKGVRLKAAGQPITAKLLEADHQLLYPAEDSIFPEAIFQMEPGAPSGILSSRLAPVTWSSRSIGARANSPIPISISSSNSSALRR